MYLKIGGAALNQTPIDWENNTDNIIHSIKKAKEEQIKILCLPELCITGYGCDDLFLSDWLCSTALEQLGYILPHTSDIAVAVGLPICLEGKLYNCSCFIYNLQIMGFSAKQNLAFEGVHYENRWFQPWPAGITKLFNFQNHDYPLVILPMKYLV